jgi:hypothetical protein
MARVELSVAIAWVEQWRIIGPSYTATTLFIDPKKTDLIEREEKTGPSLALTNLMSLLEFLLQGIQFLRSRSIQFNKNKIYTMPVRAGGTSS